MTTDIQQADKAIAERLVSNESAYKDLLKPPPIRKHGLRWDYWFVIWVGAFVIYLCLAGLFLKPPAPTERFVLGIDISAILMGSLPLVLIMLGIYYTSPNISNKRKMSLRYPGILRMAKKIPNLQRKEFMHYRVLPLNVDGRRVFLIGCGIQGQKYLVNGALLDENATLIDNDELFRRAHMTLNFAGAIVIGHSDTSQMKNQVKTELRKIPGFRKVLEQNYPRFERLELTESAKRVMEWFERVEWAYQERMRFLNASYAYAGAAGYWSADEYFYEDAKRFHELDIAFARQLSEQYLVDVRLRATVAAALIKAVNAKPGGWNNRGKLIQALEFLVGANLVLEHWIKMSTTEVEEQMERLQKGYREKLDDLRSRGFQIASE